MILLISGFLIAVVSGYFSFVEKSIDNALDHKSNNNNIGVFLMLIIGSSMSLISGVQSNISAKSNEDSIKVKDQRYTALLLENSHKSDNLRDRVDSAKNRIISLQDISLKESARIRDSLVRAKSQIISLQKRNYQELYNQATGGKQIPIMFGTCSGNEMNFMIKNIGIYSIPDVVVSYIDNYDIRKDFGAVDYSKPGFDLLNYGHSYNIGTLYSKSASAIFHRTVPKEWSELSYVFMVYYKNGAYQYNVSLKRNEKGELTITGKYFDMQTHKLIKIE